MDNKKIITGAVLIAAGLFFLIGGHGFSFGSVLETYAGFWPLILIAAGIFIILRPNRKTGILIAAFLLAVPFAVSLRSAGNDVFSYSGKGEPGLAWVVEKTGFEEASLELKLGDAVLETAAAGEDDFFVWHGTAADRKPEIILKEKNGTGILKIDARHSTGLFFRGEEYRAKADFGSGVLWKDMEINAGRLTLAADFREVRMEEIELKADSADIDAIFGETDTRTVVRISAEKLDGEIAFPAEAGTRLRIDGGLEAETPEEEIWNQAKGYYVSDNYTVAATKYDISFKAEQGSLKITIAE